MTPERWQQVDRLLEQALGHEPGRRAGFLDDACQGDAALRQEIESLLSAHGKAGEFIEAGPVGGAAGRTSVAAAQPLTGRQLEHYQILSRLGEGGMGIVYKARDTHLDRFVAIKVLPPELVADLDRKRRFVQEAKAASALNHPNIITVHDISGDNGTDFIVMEYVQGKTLGQLIPRRGLKLNDALKYAIQIADALAKAQAAGIIHRDLKPGNIMVSEGGLIKVLDFGLAKLTERPQVGATEATGTMPPWTDEGTIFWAPLRICLRNSQAAGKPLDARSDIFSFGSVLYEMVTGQRPFQGDSKMSTLAAVLNQEPKPASEISRAIPYDLEKIITRCLRKDPERRFQHMADVRVALRELLEDASTDPTGIVSPAHSKTRRVIAVGGLLACLVALALGVWLWRSLRKSDELPMKAVPLTTYPGHERSPSFSPDGNQVAFSWNGERQDNFDIYVKLIGVDGAPLQLTRDPAEDSNPAWSPDGRWIAFLRELGDGKAAVLRVPPSGGQEKKLGELHKPWFGVGCPLTWSSKGDSLVIVDRESDSEPYGLFALSVDSGEKHRLTSPPALTRGDFGPAVSPDGHTIAFIRTMDFGSADIHRLPVSEGLRAEGEPKRLTSGWRYLSNPAWTPDGREIIFSDGDPGFALGRFGNLWRVAATGVGEPRQLVADGNGFGLCIPRQKNRLVYTREVSDVNIWRVEISGRQVKGAHPERFIFSTRDETNPQISPDGTKVAFSSNRSGTGQIWICDSDGSNPVQLTSSVRGDSSSPRWSPDSHSVSFDSNIDGQWEVYVVDANGGRPRRLTSHPASDLVPSWSRDGQWIYFGSNRNGSYQVWKMPSSGGEASQITQKGGLLPLESTDGKFVYYMKGYTDRRIWKVPKQGGEEVQVLEPIFRRDYDVGNDGIYFIPGPDLGKDNSIRFLSFSTGKIKNIASIGSAWGNYISVSPDGCRILYPKIESENNDLMLVENFR